MTSNQGPHTFQNHLYLCLPNIKISDVSLIYPSICGKIQTTFHIMSGDILITAYVRVRKPHIRVCRYIFKDHIHFITAVSSYYTKYEAIMV